MKQGPVLLPSICLTLTVSHHSIPKMKQKQKKKKQQNKTQRKRETLTYYTVFKKHNSAMQLQVLLIEIISFFFFILENTIFIFSFFSLVIHI